MTLSNLFSSAFAAFAVVAASSAHAGLFDNLDFSGSKRRLETYAKVLDKPLVDHFYVLSEDGKKEGLSAAIPAASGYTFRNLTEGSLTVRKPYFVGDNLGGVIYEMREFAKSPLEDDLGKQYVAFANARGNSVHLYKPAMGGELNRLFDPHFEFHPAKNIRNWLNAENALIEVAPDGRVVSVQMRAHQAIENFTARSYQYVTIVFGKDYMLLFENRISNSFMSETFMRVVDSTK